MIVFDKPKALTDAPLHYCPGCTHGIIHRLVAEAIDKLEIGGETIGESHHIVLLAKSQKGMQNLNHLIPIQRLQRGNHRHTSDQFGNQTIFNQILRHHLLQ